MKQQTCLSAVLAGLLLTTLPAAAKPGRGLERLDADGDGRISRAEFQLPEERAMPRPFARADADGDGAISRDEVLAALEKHEQRSDERRDRLLAMFDEGDENGDGVLSRDEMENGAFARLDLDGDGYITTEEARAAHEQRREKRQRWKEQRDGEG